MPQPTPTDRETRPDVVAEIAGKGDVPAAARVIQRLNESVRRENCKAMVVARTILQDPGLSSKVLRVVNSSFYRHGGEPISTISRAVIVLGFDAIRDLTAGILLMEQLVPKGKEASWARDTLTRSLRCGLVAQALSSHVGYPHREEAYLLGLFANLGCLWLASYYPEQFVEVRALVDREHIALDEAVSRVFGLRPAELSASILEHWDFPTSYSSYFRNPQPDPTTRAHDTTTKLAAMVSLAAQYTSEDGATDAVLQGFQAQFALSPEHFVAAVESAEGTFRVQAPMLGITPPKPPAAHHAPQVRPPADGAGVADATDAGAADATDAPSALAVIAEITQAILAHENINDILSMVLEGLARAGHFDSVLLALLNSTRDRIVGRLGFGEGVEAFLRTLVVPLRPDAGALVEAMLTRQARVVSKGTPADLVPRGDSTGTVRLTSFVTCPLIVRQKAVGALVAARAGQPAIADADLAVVQLFCNQASLAFDRAAG